MIPSARNLGSLLLTLFVDVDTCHVTFPLITLFLVARLFSILILDLVRFHLRWSWPSQWMRHSSQLR
jgi:hypothetical protein